MTTWRESCALHYVDGTLYNMISPTAESLVPECFNDILPYVVNVAKRTPYETYIGRSGRGRVNSGWGNPYKMRSNSLKARIEAVTGYWDLLQSDSNMLARLHDIAGSTLGCWCAPQLCHGHVIAAAAQHGHENHALSQWMEDLHIKGKTLPYRLLVTGSRDWQDEETIRKALFQQWHAWDKPSDSVLVVGGANGADAIAARLWQRAGFAVETHQAEWGNLGKRAGMVRNAAMISSGVDAALAFQSGETPGTRQCSEAAKKAGIPISIFTPINDSHV
jgi:hypothetical protein